MNPFSTVYQRLCEDLMEDGAVVKIRGQETRELLAVSFRLDPEQPLADRPNFNERFALMETLQVIHGRGDLNHLRRIAPNFPTLAPTYVTYGPRLAWQLAAVATRLRDDPDSRQALLSVYEPQDFYKLYPDLPCTLSLQFLLRDGKLNAIATMRSNDVWFGTPNDVYMFTFFQRELARVLDVELGFYQHQVGSLHVYAQHYDRLAEVGGKVMPDRVAAHHEGDLWSDVRRQAGELLDRDLAEDESPVKRREERRMPMSQPAWHWAEWLNERVKWLA